MCVNSMGSLDTINHLFNFMAPAAAVACMLVLCGRWMGVRGGALPSGWRQFFVVFAVGLLALAGGLALFGRDGKMLTYAALVVSAATCQWVLVRGWRG